MGETFNIILGAGIAIITSVVTILITEYLKVKRDTREQKRKILEDRITAIEDGALLIVTRISNLRLGVIKRDIAHIESLLERDEIVLVDTKLRSNDSFGDSMVSVIRQIEHFNQVWMCLGILE